MVSNDLPDTQGQRGNARLMPRVFAELLQLELLLHTLVSVQGQSFIELFSGAGIFTLSLLWLKVPCLCPWDTKYGDRFNLISHGWMVLKVAWAGLL